MRAGQDRQADRVGVLLDRGLDDLLRRLVQAGVDDLDAGVAQRPGDDLRAAVVAVQAGLGDDDAQRTRSRHVGRLTGPYLTDKTRRRVFPATREGIRLPWKRSDRSGGLVLV